MNEIGSSTNSGSERRDGTAPIGSARAEVDARLAGLGRAREAVASIVVGQEGVIDEVFTALLAGGHVLIESAPGLGKTLLVRTLGAVCGLEFSRIQFTPDLMPADITGTVALSHDEQGNVSTRFQPGPVFAQMVLTDEVNRATPKTQSALLEAMQERTVTVAGRRYELPEPFFVLATQNPIEMEGTYVLPEAQVDRFLLKVVLPFPSQAVLESIIDATTGARTHVPERVLTPAAIQELQALTLQVPISGHLTSAVARFVRSSQPTTEVASAKVQRYVRFGVSPRGAQALVLAAKARALLSGRYAVAEQDLLVVALPALRHRFQLNFEGQADGVDAEAFVLELLREALSGSA